MRAWFADNAAWIGLASVGMLVLGVILVPVLLVAIPEGYFVRPDAPPGSWRRRHPALRMAIRVGKDVAGVILIVAGVLMLLLPGQGILCILLGVILVDFPGKRAAELRIMRIDGVHRAIDAIRRRLGRAPLRLPPVDEPDTIGPERPSESDEA